MVRCLLAAFLVFLILAGRVQAGDLGDCQGAEGVVVGDPASVISACTPYAEKGETTAGLRIGLAYEFGNAPVKDVPRAYQWYRISDGLLAYYFAKTGDLTGWMKVTVENVELRARFTKLDISRIVSPGDKILGIRSAREWLRRRSFLTADMAKIFDQDLAGVLSDAAIYGDAQTTSLALEEGINPNSRSGPGYTPLILAAKRNQLAIVKLLLAHGADPSLQDDSGQSALSAASRGGYADIVAALRAAGARD